MVGLVFLWLAFEPARADDAATPAPPPKPPETQAGPAAATGQAPLVLIDAKGWNAEKEFGLNTLKLELTQRGLIVKTTSEVAGFSAPPVGDNLLSGALVFITDRRDSYSSEEVEAIDQYVWNGGSLLCSTDSDVSPNFIQAANTLLACFGMKVSSEGKIGQCTELTQHPVNANVSSVVNDDGAINISFSWAVPLAKIDSSVVAAASDQGYGKVAVVDADIIYDGEGKNIGLGDNRTFATNLVLWLAGKEIPVAQGQPPATSAAPTATPPVELAAVGGGTKVEGKPVTCPICGGRLLLGKEGDLAVPPPGLVEGGVCRFPHLMVVALKDSGQWAVFGIEMETLPGVKVEAQLLEGKANQEASAIVQRLAKMSAEDLADKVKVQALNDGVKSELDTMLGGGKVAALRLKPLLVASGPS
jgi:hypothetical protein